MISIVGLNTLMRRCWKEPVDLEDLPTLERGLRRLVDEGFESHEGALFLRHGWERRGGASLSDFPDRTGFEAYLNHIHLDRMVKPQDRSQADLLGQAISLAAVVASQAPGLPLEHIIAATDGSVTYRFHVKREGESWIADDLDGYSGEAILILRSPAGGTVPVN